jgi:Putative DNA-binding domain
VEKPRTLHDLQTLISNRVQEDLHLDYKASPSISDNKRGEIAKDVSAFANSDGGVLVYGIEEGKDHYPVRVDGGIDATHFNREWLENIVTSNISPRIDGLVISPIEITAGRCAYVVEVPKSYRGPHQERTSKRYHKRFNFKSEPMEDYEINDVRNRRDVVQPLISVGVDIYHGALMHLVVSNIGDIPAEKVSFEITPQIPPELARLNPPLIMKGTDYFPPKREYRFFIGSALEHLHEDALHAFDVTTTYFNPRVGSTMTEAFHIELLDYLQSAITESDVKELGEKLVKVIGEVKNEISQAKSVLQGIAPVATPTGLALSFSTMRNLQNLRDGEQTIEKIDPYQCPVGAFREVLGTDDRTAQLLHHYFRWRHTIPHTVDGVTGVTPQVVEGLKKHFAMGDADLPEKKASASDEDQVK